MSQIKTLTLKRQRGNTALSGAVSLVLGYLDNQHIIIMNKKLLTLLLATLPIMANAQNVFMDEFKTVHHMTPFDKIQNSDYEEAIDKGIAESKAEIDAIANNTAAPTFENTILALENSGKTLDRVLNVFYPLLSSNADDEMMQISMRISPKLSELSTYSSLNEKLWERVKTVYNNRAALNLDKESAKLLQNTYDSFARSGANLEGAAREEYKKLSARLSELTTTYGQNVLKEQNKCEMWITKDDLEGLPQSAIDAYAFDAKKKGREGEYLVNVSYPSYGPFMKYSSRRDLREKLYRIYNTRNTQGEYNNLPILKEIAETRMKIANLLGYKTYADYSLVRTMAENPTNVYNLLNQLRDAYMPAWQKEYKELKDFAAKYTGDKKFELKPWDYSFFSNKLKDSKYSVNDEELRPYFELSNVVKGVFGLATKLYGLHFTQNDNIIVYHPDVRAYDVTDDNGNFIGIIYTDFFPRESKRGGAWMTEFRGEKYIDGVRDCPHVTITMNFSKPTESEPALLTFGEVETFLHEFGHAIHGLLADTKYGSMSGTSVYRDFVELPSQFNENFLTEREFLDSFAKNYKTGEAMPQALIDRVIASSRFGAGYACLRQLNFGLLDMAWHTITAPVEGDAAEFENNAIKSVQLFAPIDGCMISPQFSHIFSGGYAAGYYSYKWSEVLDADAFAAFKEVGIFNKDKAQSFRDNVLSRGGTEHPMDLYKRFRGQEPTVDALLERDGIKTPKKQPKQKKLNKKD